MPREVNHLAQIRTQAAVCLDLTLLTTRAQFSPILAPEAFKYIYFSPSLLPPPS